MKITTVHISDGFVEPQVTSNDYAYGEERSIGNKLGALGATEEVLRPDGEWDASEIVNELQARGFDTAGCTVFNTLTQIEIYEKEKFGTVSNYSDRFIYNAAGITPPGADPNRAYEVIRTTGLVQEEDCPWNANTLEEYSKPRPPSSELLFKAKAWIDKYILKHEYLPLGANGYVTLETLKTARTYSPITIAVQAWSFDGEKYVRTGGDTHWTQCIGQYENGDLKILDSYEPYEKRLDKDFNIKWAKKIWIGERATQTLNIFQQIINAIAKILQLQEVYVQEVVKKKVETPPPVEVIEPPKYLWGTREEARHSVRVICDEEGLSVSEKNIICAVIDAESGFNISAKNVNKDGTVDLGVEKLGIAQLNSHWYIDVMKLATREQALNDPEYCVRLMIKRYKEGFLSDWSAYKSGVYKSYL